ncbi:DUF7507 domain-containing protein [Laspinema palackyanum]|uniref:DUF7507 domain-containing protein n=1 Tax=Laspinema palackyanum TaxID=3231601 RepID=UPI00345D0E0A|nr:hypothetical protein [Laspinema sp. D2c]
MSNTTTSFVLNEFTGSDAQVEVTLSDIGEDVVQVSLKVVSGYLADAVGFFADFNDLDVNNNFTITAVDSKPGPLLTVGTTTGSGLLYLDDSGSTIDGEGDLDSNVNLNGQGIKRDYALGVQIGAGGLGGGDDYQEVTFNLSTAGLSTSNFSKIGMRLQSVLDDGTRDGSSKLEGVPDTETPTPLVAISKVTNGADGQTILAGEDITWTYLVTNTGNVTLTNLQVTDDNGTPDQTSDDFVVGTIAELVAGQSQSLNFFGGQAIIGEYSNMGKVATTYNTTPVTSEDSSDYFGADPGIAIDKVTNGADGQTILAGTEINWTYTVTNTGNVALSNVSVTDDKEGTIANLVSGDIDEDGSLDTNETWVYEATGTAVAGEYTNMGRVEGSFTDDLGNEATPTAEDPSDYFGADPGIAIDKVTDNGVLQADGLVIQEGSAIDWIYTVTNTGNVGLSNVVVTDNDPGVLKG